MDSLKFVIKLEKRFKRNDIISNDYDNDLIDEQISVGEVNDVKFVDKNTLLASITLFNLPYTASAEEVNPVHIASIYNN